MLAAAFEREHVPVRVTREPGGTRLGERIRELLLHSPTDVGRRAELFLILADRAEHVGGLIRPALESGLTVLCDRFSDSTLAYQAYGRGLPVEEVRAVEGIARQGLLPSLTFVLDCPVEVGLARTRRRRAGAAADRFEAEEAGFHERVRQGFLGLAREDPRRMRVVDATRSTDEVHREILAACAAELGLP